MGRDYISDGPGSDEDVVVGRALDLTGKSRDCCSASEEDDEGSCVIEVGVPITGKAGEAIGAEGIVFAMA